MSDVKERLRWEISVQLERPSNYGRRVTLNADDVLSLLDPAPVADHPHRVQLSRKAGWRMPPNTVKVSRPGRFGNPFAAKIPHGEEGQATMTREYLVADFRRWITEPVMDWPDRPAFAAGDTARTHHLGVPYEGRPTLDEIQAKLRGRNLACWCPLSQPCHADVLLELANAVPTSPDAGTLDGPDKATKWTL